MFSTYFVYPIRSTIIIQYIHTTEFNYLPDLLYTYDSFQLLF